MEKIKNIEIFSKLKYTFAKTYANFAPHEYIVKSRLSHTDKLLFPAVVKFIIEEGEFEVKYGRNWPCYKHDGFKYWICGKPLYSKHDSPTKSFSAKWTSDSQWTTHNLDDYCNIEGIINRVKL